MQTRKLGASELELTPVVLGAWAIGGNMWGGTEESAALEAIAASLDAGVNAIDTAPAYGLGRSEEIVGKAIRGRRDDVIIATKCGLRWDRDDGELRLVTLGADGEEVRLWYNLRPDSIREECEASLKRLGVDHIDLYQIHWPDPRHSLEDAFGELSRLREEGKVRALGVSNFSLEQLEVAHRAGAIASHQPQYNLLDRAIEKEILPWCRAHDVGVVAYSPMGRGLLTGKIDARMEFPATDHRSGHPWFQREARERVLAALDDVRPLAAAHGVSRANLAVAWVLHQPGITAALVGARTAEQARENARAAEVRLSESELAQLATAFEGVV